MPPLLQRQLNQSDLFHRPENGQHDDDGQVEVWHDDNGYDQHDECQRPKKSKLSGWQTLTRKNFPDEVRKSFSRQMHQKSA